MGNNCILEKRADCKPLPLSNVIIRVFTGVVMSSSGPGPTFALVWDGGVLPRYFSRHSCVLLRLCVLIVMMTNMVTYWDCNNKQQQQLVKCWCADNLLEESYLKKICKQRVPMKKKGTVSEQFPRSSQVDCCIGYLSITLYASISISYSGNTYFGSGWSRSEAEDVSGTI